MSTISMLRLYGRCLLLLSLLSGPAVALDIHTGDFLTNDLRIDPVTQELDPIIPIIPTAIALMGSEYIVLDSGQDNSAQYIRKVWRHDPATGKQTLVAVTDIPIGTYSGSHILSQGMGNEVILYHEDASKLIFVPRQKNTWVVFGTGNAPSA